MEKRWQRDDRHVEILGVEQRRVIVVRSGHASSFGPSAIVRDRIGSRNDVDGRHRKCRFQVYHADITDTEYAE